MINYLEQDTPSGPPNYHRSQAEKVKRLLKRLAGYKANNIKTVEVQSEGSDRDLGVNIFTGNPGVYQAEGDTLNFWSLTPVPVDSTAELKVTVEQPGKPYGFDGKPIKSVEQDWTFFLILFGWAIFASLQFRFSKYILQIFQSIVNFGAASRLYRERGYSNNFGVFRLNIIFFFPAIPYLSYRKRQRNDSGRSGIEFS